MNSMELLLCALGLVMIVEGLPYFGFPDRMKMMMRFVQELDDTTLRIAGAALMFAGLIIVFVARKGFGGP